MEDEYKFKNEITHSTKILEPAECRGGILADEMGMGKSLSLLALILFTLYRQISDNKENKYPSSQKDETRSCVALIIAPKSTIQGWEQQVKKHTRPGALKVNIYHGKGRRITRDSLSQFDIVLTTYETAASDASTSGMLSGISWLRIVLDEAHQIRNRSSENLRLALQVISLRRTMKQSCSTRRRIEAVEQVILNERERLCYIATRDDARKSLSSATGKSQGHILLRATSTLRQICSHGESIIDATPDIQPARQHTICDKCGDPIDTQNDSQQSFHGACGHTVCYECTLDQNGAEDTALNSTSSTCWVCQEPVISVLEDVQQQSGN